MKNRKLGRRIETHREKDRKPICTQLSMYHPFTIPISTIYLFLYSIEYIHYTYPYLLIVLLYYYPHHPNPIYQFTSSHLLLLITSYPYIPIYYREREIEIEIDR